MSVFHFKQFDIVNEASSMKVNTDGVLLGAAVTIFPGDREVLDAGTGTGTIALMLAQRYSALRSDTGNLSIEGIDIDEPSATEAAANFAASPWPSCLEARRCPLSEYVPPVPLDLIVSNPPFFEESLLPPEIRRGMARHASGEAMSCHDLIVFASEHLGGEGRLSLILPSDRETDVVRYGVSNSLYPFRIMRIRTTPKKDCSRIIVEFTKIHPQQVSEEILTIQDVNHYPQNWSGYTPEYLELTGDFYLWG